MLKRNHEDSSSDEDSDEDQEALDRLREAVDSETLKDNFYTKSPEPETRRSVIETTITINTEAEELLKPSCGEGDIEDPKLLSQYLKQIVKKNRLVSSKVSKSGREAGKKSLRRDKQTDYKSPVISELEVTPQFQKFVGSKLDTFLNSQIEDVGEDNLATKNITSPDSGPDPGSSLKLLKRSRLSISASGYEVPSLAGRGRGRPELLAHTRPRVSEAELAEVAVSGAAVISGLDTRAWANKWEAWVEPGVERIKKKKKKVKKKKKSKVSTENEEQVTD